MYCVAIELIAKPGLADDVVRLFREYIPIVTSLPGCLRFELNQSVEDNHQFLLYELYESRESLLAHRGDALFNVWRPRIAALEQTRRLREYDCVADSGVA
jgi:quinol monooxygenase YgiN